MLIDKNNIYAISPPIMTYDIKDHYINSMDIGCYFSIYMKFGKNHTVYYELAENVEYDLDIEPHQGEHDDERYLQRKTSAEYDFAQTFSSQAEIKYKELCRKLDIEYNPDYVEI